MRVQYKRLVVPVDCFSEQEPVLLELTTKGEIVFHNYDPDPDEAAVALGLDPSRCFEIQRNWDAIIIDSIARPSELNFYKNILPQRVIDQLARVGFLLKNTAMQAFVRSTYREPSNRWVDRAGMSFKSEFFGPRATVAPSVSGTPRKVQHSIYGKRDFPGTSVMVVLTTTVPAYITLLNKIPKGVVYDPRQDCWCLVASLVKVIDQRNAVVRAGKQGRGVSVDSRKAMVQHDSDNDWIVKKWV